MTIQIAKRIGRALNVRSGTRIKELDEGLREYVRLVPKATTTPMPGVIDAGQVTTGVLADGRVAESSVTQHQAALSIATSQLTGTLPATQGGTGQTTYTAGDILYSNAMNALAKLAIGTAGDVLRVSGGAPAWQAVSTLSIDEAQITDGTLLARLAANEVVSGLWQYSQGKLQGSGLARVFFRSASVADDATATFEVPTYALVAVITPAGASVARNGLFWVASSSETTGAVSLGANFSLGTTTNPDVDGDVNAWMSAPGELSVKNRQGTTRQITVISLGYMP